LPADNRSYFYPSVGLSAILSNLIHGIPEVLNFAKLRFSWSEVGNDAPFGMLQRNLEFSAGGRNGFLSISPTIPNTNLKPEKTSSYEIGLNLQFLSNRIGLDLTAYKENTKRQLFQISVPVGSGASSFFTNGGNIQNRGLEAMLTTTP